LRADAVAGLTVAIVALPLSMAIAIASHAPPEVGLYTAIVGGFLISALGGCLPFMHRMAQAIEVQTHHGAI
jgi:SulP family sulfate permease